MRLSSNLRFWGTAVICLMLVALNFGMFRAIHKSEEKDFKSVMGGAVYPEGYDDSFEEYGEQYVKPDDIYIGRFLRPSDEQAVEKKYSFEKGGQDLPEAFSLPGDVVRAYFDILGDASNLGNKKGGCGSIGYEGAPYPAAYNMLSETLKQNLAYEEFLKSFEGIGHINLLKFIEVPAIKVKDSVSPRFFVEIETIEGSDTEGKTYFAYYYGYVIALQEGEKGWKINGMELKSEDFLCHAYHGWWHDAGTIVEVIYKRRCGVIDKILGVEEDECFRNVMAKGKDGKQYRFMFVRITNGADIELRQFVMADGKWKDIFINPNECNDEK